MGKLMNMAYPSDDVVRIVEFRSASVIERVKDIIYKMIPTHKKHLVVLIFKDFNDMKREFDKELASMIDIKKKKSYDFFVILNNNSDEHFNAMLNYIDGAGPKWICDRTCTMTALGDDHVEEILHTIVDNCEGYETVSKYRF